MNILPIAGPFGQLGNTCFLLAGLFGDILLIRLFLTLAYVALLAGALTGYPRFGDFGFNGTISADGIAWAVVCLALHLYALCQLVRDERVIRFRSDDEEQLWRFFYRRSGMGRLEFKQVLKYGSWVRVPAGKRILGARDSRLRIFLLVEGHATFYTCYGGYTDPGRPMYSGALFDKGLLNVLGVFVGLEKGEDKLFRAVAETDCLLYSWTVEELSAMATQHGPAVAAFWRNFALSQLGMELELRSHKGAEPLCATGETEAFAFLHGARSRDFTDPLRPYEQQRRTAKGTLQWIWRSLSPFVPPGVRHTALPVNGILARNRVLALKTAAAWAALSRESSLAGECDLAPGVSVHGGMLAYHHLQRLQSIDELEAVDMVQLARELSIHGRSDYLAAVGKQPNSKANADEGVNAVEEGKGSGDPVGSPGEPDAQGSRKVVRIEVIT
ncbi:hypothetical protein N2152v2_004915 [Parachlorella kessleri]